MALHQATTKSLGTPSDEYQSALPLWKKSRAVLAGERYVKEHDLVVNAGKNMLLPFSAAMDQSFYTFYRGEAEFPGITSQYARTLANGLMRKAPTLTLPDSVPEGAKDWLLNGVCQDGSPLSSLLMSAVREELTTSRGWIFVDFPAVPEGEEPKPGELAPYPILRAAEEVIKDNYSQDAKGRMTLSSLVVRTKTSTVDPETFNKVYQEVCYVHALDANGEYYTQLYTDSRKSDTTEVVAGRTVAPAAKGEGTPIFVKNGEPIYPLIHGEKMKFIPAWQLTGNDDEFVDPVLLPLIDKEIHLYNKMSRRNHLMYGAATYTPWITTDMGQDEFDKIVSAGLGSWLRLNKDDTVGVLETPVDALEGMEAAIAAGIEEMARLGVRMMSPETAQSGVALEIRNASQVAQLGSLNTRLTATLKQVIVLLLKWRYNIDVPPSEVQLSLSEDFTNTPTGVDWLRLVTEWYQEGIISRKVFIYLLAKNELLPPDFDDKTTQQEIDGDPLRMPRPPAE